MRGKSGVPAIQFKGKSQSVISLRSLKFSRRAHVFTGHGALMAATVLNSARAVKMSLFLIRAFVRLRKVQAANAIIFRRLANSTRFC